MGRGTKLTTLVLVALLCAVPAAGAFTHGPQQGRRARVRPRLHALAIHYRNPRALRAAKLRAARRARAGRVRAARGPRATVFAGLNAPGLSAGEATPPDTTGAVGPSHYIEMVNSQVAVYDRGTLGLVSGPAALEDFMANPSGSVTDPQVQWDPQGQRWFYLASSFGSGGENHVLFGWSKTADPTNLASGWCRYNLGSGSGTAADGFLFDDYPKLGHDDAHLVFGTEAFGDTSTNFVTSRVYVVPKPSAGTSACPPTPPFSINGTPTKKLKTSAGNQAFVVVPANTFDSSTGAYVVAADDPSASGGSASHIMAWHVGAGDASAGTPTLVPDSNIAVRSYGVPPNVPQPSTASTCLSVDQSFCLDTLDGRLTLAVAVRDPDAGAQQAVWTQHTVSDSNGRSAMRWYELLPGSGAARQQGSINDPTGYVFNGAASPTATGNSAALFYNVGGANQLVQIRARTRGPSLAPGASGGETTIGTSAAPDNDFTCSVNPPQPNAGPCRWGDYSGAAPDPSNAALVWGANQLVGSASPPPIFPPRWTTRIFAVSDSPPTASFTTSPSPTALGQVTGFDGSGSADTDGVARDFAWTFGDGASIDSGASTTTSHAYSAPGTYPVSLTVTDDSGSSATASGSVTVAAAPLPTRPLVPLAPRPSISPPFMRSLRVTSKRPRAKRARSRRLRPATNLVVFDLSRAASVRLTVTGPRAGRLAGRKCRAVTRSNRRGRRCTLTVTIRTFYATGRPGTNTVSLPGGARLKPGTYSLTAVATADGLSSAPRSAKFRPARRA